MAVNYDCRSQPVDVGHNTKHDDTWHNNIQHIKTQHNDSQHVCIQLNDKQHNEGSMMTVNIATLSKNSQNNSTQHYDTSIRRLVQLLNCVTHHYLTVILGC
jgi:hypothetical protein